MTTAVEQLLRIRHERTVTCPYCNAQPGEKCHSLTTDKALRPFDRSVHPARLAALKAKEAQ